MADTTSVWKPETFTNFTARQQRDREGADNALDFTIQTLATQAQNALGGVESLQPSGGLTRNRPSNPALYTPFWDTSLNKIIYFQGKGVWKDAMGTVS